MNTQSLQGRPADYLKLTEAVRLFPGETNPESLARFIVRGAALKDGTRVKLAAVRAPGGWRTTRAAVVAFVERLTTDRLGEPEPANANELAGATA